MKDRVTKNLCHHLAVTAAVILLSHGGWSNAQEGAAPPALKPAAQDTLITEPAITDTTKSAKIFLDKIEVLGTVAKPQALFILPGNDPTIDGLTIERSFFKEIFRPVQWDDFNKVKQPTKTRSAW